VRRGGAFVEEDLITVGGRAASSAACPADVPVISRSWHVSAGLSVSAWASIPTEIGVLASPRRKLQSLPIWSIMVFTALSPQACRSSTHRWRADARRLWLGLTKPDPQALLQFDITFVSVLIAC